MKKKSIELVRELTELSGIPGFESDVRDYMRARLEPLGRIETDNLGSLLCTKEGPEGAPRLMVPAHMDEIGFVVKDVTETGQIKFSPLGGWLDQTLLGHPVCVRTRKRDLCGVIGCTPPHLMPKDQREKVIPKKSMFIDVGAKDKKEATGKFGVRCGDPIVPVQKFMEMANPKFLLAKAWDNRVGCALVIELMEALKTVKTPCTVIGVGTVQEEVGTRGAETSADVADPEFCVTLDVGIATDVPGIEGEVKVECGKGPIVYMVDAGTISHRRFRDFVIETAEEKKIPVQLSLLEGGATDARAIQLHARGVASVMVGIPARYIHSHAGVIHADDYDATAKLLVAVAKALTAAKADELLERG